jgi:hypothetical protein
MENRKKVRVLSFIRENKIFAGVAFIYAHQMWMICGHGVRNLETGRVFTWGTLASMEEEEGIIETI